jgi:PEP-CTERM motif
MRTSIFAAGLGAAMLAAAPAAATLINFDDVPTVFQESFVLAPGYQGFDWTNARALNAINQGEGYLAGMVSGPNVLFNIFGVEATVSSSTPFTLNSGYFTNAFFGDQNVIVTGFNGGTQVFSDSFAITRSSPTFRTFSNASITSFTFVGSNGSQVVIDDLTVNEATAPAVPEPASWLMMIVGFGAVGTVLRRRERTAAAMRFA